MEKVWLPRENIRLEKETKVLGSQQSCLSPTQREAEQLKEVDVRGKDGGQVLERGVKDRLKIGVTLKNEVIDQTGEQKHKRTGHGLHLHMFQI